MTTKEYIVEQILNLLETTPEVRVGVKQMLMRKSLFFLQQKLREETAFKQEIPVVDVNLTY